MKGCVLRLLLSFLLFAALAAAVSTGLNHYYGTPTSDSLGVSIFSGLFAWVAVNLVMSAGTAWRERRAILAGIAGGAPVDGRKTILVGYIDAAGPSLQAPLSGRDCVAYTFEVYEIRGSGKRQSKVVYCDGIALTPSLIVTRTGSYRLLAVPELVCEAADLDREAALPRVAELMRTLPFTPAVPFSRPSIADQWNDDDGAYRRESRRVEGEVNLADCRMTERHLERGARVCVFGQFSEAKRAIVGDPKNWSKITRVMKGDANAIARQLRGSVVRRTIGAVVFGGVAAGIIAAFVADIFQ